jgi:hypothetical protein
VHRIKDEWESLGRQSMSTELEVNDGRIQVP